jgi:replicative DNA helicase Mcm
MNKEELESELKKTLEIIKGNIKLEDGTAEIDLNNILELNHEIYESILNEPEKLIPSIEESLKSIFLKAFKVKLFNINNLKEISKIRVTNLDNLVSVKGILKRVTKVIPRTVSIEFICMNCGSTILIPQNKKVIRKPQNRCAGCGSMNKFEINKNINKDIQEVILEEIHENLEGKQPQQIRVYLEGELTDSSLTSKLQPGRKVEIIGIIKKLPAFMSSKDEDSNVSEFMINTNNLVLLEAEDDTNINEEDERLIKEIASNNPLEYLARNLVPEVYGNDIVKKAIVLQMVKGVPKNRTDGSQSQSDIHILLSGDVGISKSVSLKATAKRTPRARMITGTKTSKTSLSAMAIKDDLLGVWCLESGPIVMANGSTICIDELDKLNKEHLADLLEPMSAGIVTVSKAGINAVLPARTSILAAANPIHGNYDLNQPLAKQIDLPTPIINRFDLIFILLDKPNEKFDGEVIEHIFKAYKQEIKSVISNELFKKYITYCRKLKPQLSDDIIEPIKTFYINLRKRSERDGSKGIPVNLRGIEGLIKLAEANAKIRLSEVVERQDLEVAKEILLFCLAQIGFDDETGIYDMSRITEKVPFSKKGKVDAFWRIIKEIYERMGKNLNYSDIIYEAKKVGIDKWDCDNYIEELKKDMKIIEPEKGIYRII